MTSAPVASRPATGTDGGDLVVLDQHAPALVRRTGVLGGPDAGGLEQDGLGGVGEAGREDQG
jgi:hypothetical protein